MDVSKMEIHETESQVYLATDTKKTIDDFFIKKSSTSSKPPTKTLAKEFNPVILEQNEFQHQRKSELIAFFAPPQCIDSRIKC